jgi:hypothetical protein
LFNNEEHGDAAEQDGMAHHEDVSECRHVASTAHIYIPSNIKAASCNDISGCAVMYYAVMAPDKPHHAVSSAALIT